MWKLCSKFVWQSQFNDNETWFKYWFISEVDVSCRWTRELWTTYWTPGSTQQRWYLAFFHIRSSMLQILTIKPFMMVTRFWSAKKFLEWQKSQELPRWPGFSLGNLHSFVLLWIVIQHFCSKWQWFLEFVNLQKIHMLCNLPSHFCGSEYRNSMTDLKNAYNRYAVAWPEKYWKSICSDLKKMTDVSNVERLTEVSQAEVSTFLTRNVIALSFARKKALQSENRWTRVYPSSGWEKMSQKTRWAFFIFDLHTVAFFKFYQCVSICVVLHNTVVVQVQDKVGKSKRPAPPPPPKSQIGNTQPNSPKSRIPNAQSNAPKTQNASSPKSQTHNVPPPLPKKNKLRQLKNQPSDNKNTENGNDNDKGSPPTKTLNINWRFK